MIRLRRRGNDALARRRSGPANEPRWWDVEDQRFVEGVHVTASHLGRGWRAFPMLNNEERLDPHGPDEAGRILSAARAGRRPTALDEGRAWRRRATGSLLVTRLEMFERADDEHRRLWALHGPDALRQVWRSGWADRGVTPGWIEVRLMEDPGALIARSDPVADSVDVMTVEDHTGGDRDVAVYTHMMLWLGRFTATLTLRCEYGEEIDPAIGRAAVALELAARKAGVSRK